MTSFIVLSLIPRIFSITTFVMLNTFVLPLPFVVSFCICLHFWSIFFFIDCNIWCNITNTEKNRIMLSENISSCALRCYPSDPVVEKRDIKTGASIRNGKYQTIYLCRMAIDMHNHIIYCSYKYICTFFKKHWSATSFKWQTLPQFYEQCLWNVCTRMIWTQILAILLNQKGDIYNKRLNSL